MMENREFVNWNKASMAQKEATIAEPKRFFVFADLRASETDIGELRLQEMSNGKDFITFKYNVLFRAMSDLDAMGVLFLDEMNLASNLTKSQFYKLINDHAIGDIPLSDGILIASAGNESQHSRGVTDDPVPLVTRRGNYFIRPLTQEEFNDYMVATGHHPNIVGYLAFQPGDVHRIAYDLPDSVGQPCVRTWSKLSNLMNRNPRLTVDQVEMLASGFVGQATATKFGAFVRAARKIDIDAIMEHPELMREYNSERELSLSYAVISAVVDKWRQNKKYLKSALNISLEIDRPELGAYMIRSVKMVDTSKWTKAFCDDSIVDKVLVDKIMDRYGKYIIDK